ncbi:hypothetical protein BEWA_021490 [Theileria equi strain WA]|uniref:Activator of Hsp90 ATPase AHSA1-like N-terminal domain-containing protein n=1 Tax=Theileria equi strain WA TaxID=1537102 RepID=L0AW97_THEEQ|nr:hypothetical protein BEWA_021490 [Theileria equi strain WA]AFZ79301.1 hypothetical protein BEWA_021490 [Theileria equi strain WA]|eukprot:XP_004828967.1 hypothetical protein BEWA_021490 [Theileria equi strain WA]
MSDTSSDTVDTNVDEFATAEECVAKATSYKASGNESFKAADFSKASEHYENGITWLKKIQEHNDSQKELLSVLCSNLSASYIETSDYIKARDMATDAIKWNENNKKAYYRRARAYFNTGSLDEALNDCNHLLKEDPNDGNVRSLLARVNEKLRIAKKEQKKAFGGLFDKVGGLYDDRQLEMQNKKQKKYADYTREKREKGETEMDFEAWEKHEQEEEAKREVERTKKVKEEDEKTTKKSVDVDETPEFDEEDEKIISETKKMGYCYFGKQRSDIEKNSSQTAATSTVNVAPQKVDVNSKDQDYLKRSISSWNSQGTTYEEKDMTSWCKKKFEEYIMGASYTNEPNVEGSKNIVEMFNDINLDNLDSESDMNKLQKLAGMMYKSSIKPTSVEGVDGDAQIAFIRGTRRYLFDLSCTLNVEITIDTSVGSGPAADSAESSHISNYNGVLTLREISSEKEVGKTWKDYITVKYKSTIKPEHSELLKDMMEKYKSIVCDKIDEFLSEYQMQ